MRDINEEYNNINPKATSMILSSVDLQKSCEQVKIPYHEIDLSELENSKSVIFTFVHTGSEANEFNNGVIDHWLFKIGPWLFDSYSSIVKKGFKIPTWSKQLPLYPSQLQEWGSNVCGDYCFVIYYYAYNSFDDLDLNNNRWGIQWCEKMGFSSDRKANDIRIHQAYENIIHHKKENNVEGGGIFSFLDDIPIIGSITKAIGIGEEKNNLNEEPPTEPPSEEGKGMFSQLLESVGLGEETNETIGKMEDVVDEQEPTQK